MEHSEAQESTASLVAKLRQVGFNDQDAKVYIHLLNVQPATGYEISKASGVQRANVYSILDTLTVKGIVRPVSENPVRFIALPPKEVLGRIRHEVNTIVDELQSALEARRVHEGHDIVWNLRGEAALRQKFEQLLASAQQRVLVKGLDRHLEPHLPSLKACCERGVDLHVVLFGQANMPFGRVYPHEGTGVPVGEAADNLTLVVDSREVLMGRLVEPTEGAYTENRALVQVAETLIRHDIYMTAIMLRLGPELVNAFGPHLVELRRQYLTDVQVQDLQERIRLEASGKL